MNGGRPGGLNASSRASSSGTIDRPAEERVEQDRAVRARRPHEEVSRKADALDRDAAAAAHLDQHHREGDGDAEAPLEDVVQEAVARIVVVVGVAAEALDGEEMPGDRHQPAGGIAGRVDVGPRGQRPAGRAGRATATDRVPGARSGRGPVRRAPGPYGRRSPPRTRMPPAAPSPHRTESNARLTELVRSLVRFAELAQDDAERVVHGGARLLRERAP